MRIRREHRNAAIALLIFSSTAFILLPYVNDIIGTVKVDSPAIELKNEKRRADARQQQYYAVPEVKRELFPFDPNTADSTQLLRLGLRPWQVRNIYKYRAHGGRYRVPSDFARLYGLTAAEYRRLLPYIRIVHEPMAAEVYGGDASGEGGNVAGQGNPGASQVSEKQPEFTYQEKIKTGEHININTADTTELKRIPGIGSFYSRRIVQLRQRLGGFASVSQLREIDGFPEDALPYASVGEISTTTHVPIGIQRLRINHLTARELSRHHYIRYIQGKQIEDYRRVNGPLRSPSDLHKIPSFTPETIQQLTPYLDFD